MLGRQGTTLVKTNRFHCLRGNGLVLNKVILSRKELRKARTD